MKIQDIHKYKLPYNKRIKGLNWILNRFVMISENLLLRQKPIQNCIGKSNGEEKIILSMTTYPGRNNIVGWTIKSLLNQSVPVDRFILWLAKEQYPEEYIPKEIQQYMQYGLEVRFCDDLRSHKKYYYSMLENPDAVVITVDDDVIYPEDTVEKLLRMHKKFPDTVICNQARWIAVEGDRLAPYVKWRAMLPEKIEHPSYRILPIGEGGILYPPGVLYKDLFSKELLMSLAPSVDDLWLKFMAVKQGKRAMVSEPEQRGLCPVWVVGQNSSSLQSQNVHGGNNDIAIGKILRHYPELFVILQNDTFPFLK